MKWYFRVHRHGTLMLVSASVLAVLLALPAAAGEPVSGKEAEKRIVYRAHSADSWSPARIRMSVLYRGGEFSTFRRQSSPSGRPLIETAAWTPPLDRRLEDEWFAVDKAQHLAFSFLWTLGTQYAAVNKGGLSEHRALPVSISSSAVIGVTKEYYDLRSTCHFSLRDLVADAVGIILAAGVILL